jgi:hypothetical protein
VEELVAHRKYHPESSLGQFVNATCAALRVLRMSMYRDHHENFALDDFPAERVAILTKKRRSSSTLLFNVAGTTQVHQNSLHNNRNINSF